MTQLDIRVRVPPHVAKHVAENDENGTLRNDHEYEVPVGDDAFVVLHAGVPLDD